MTKEELQAKRAVALSKLKDIEVALCLDEHYIDIIEKENAELKKKIGIYQKGMFEEIEKRDKKLAKATDLIENIIRVTWGEGWNYSLDWKVKAEQFLKDLEK